jgi:hypothetical protein
MWWFCLVVADISPGETDVDTKWTTRRYPLDNSAPCGNPTTFPQLLCELIDTVENGPI